MRQRPRCNVRTATATRTRTRSASLVDAPPSPHTHTHPCPDLRPLAAVAYNGSYGPRRSEAAYLKPRRLKLADYYAAEHAAAQARLHRLQHPASCANASFIRGISWNTEKKGYGYGSRFLYYRTCLTQAVLAGRTYVQEECFLYDCKEGSAWRRNCVALAALKTHPSSFYTPHANHARIRQGHFALV